MIRHVDDVWNDNYDVSAALVLSGVDGVYILIDEKIRQHFWNCDDSSEVLLEEDFVIEEIIEEQLLHMVWSYCCVFGEGSDKW